MNDFEFAKFSPSKYFATEGNYKPNYFLLTKGYTGSGIKPAKVGSYCTLGGHPQTGHSLATKRDHQVMVTASHHLVATTFTI